MIEPWMIQVLGMIATGAGVYAAIRADLARAIVTAENAHSSAGEAHKRIDSLLMKG